MKEKLTVVVTPLYYVLEESAHVFANLKQDDIVLGFDDIAPLPPLAQRFSYLSDSLNIPLGKIEFEEILYHDNSEEWDKTIASRLREIRKSNPDKEVYVIYFPTKKIRKLKWADEIYIDFMGVDLAEEFNELIPRFEPNFEERYSFYLRTFVEGRYRYEGKLPTFIVYGNFVKEGKDFEVILASRDMSSVTCLEFNELDFVNNPSLIDVYVDGASVYFPEFIKNLGLSIDNMPLVAKIDLKDNYNYTVVLELEDTPDNLEIIHSIVNREIDTRIDTASNLIVLLPNSEVTSKVAWFRHLISEGLAIREAENNA